MVLLTIAVVAGVAAVVAGVVSGGLADPESSIPQRSLPAGPVTGRDIAELRFDQSFRGYRMDQVDAAMDALALEVDQLRRRLSELDAAPSAEPGSDPEPAVVPVDLEKQFPADETSAWPAAWPTGRD